MRDPLVDKASERLVAIYSRALKLTQEFFPKLNRYDQYHRVTILSLMKMLVELAKLEQERR